MTVNFSLHSNDENYGIFSLCTVVRFVCVVSAGEYKRSCCALELLFSSLHRGKESRNPNITITCSFEGD